jgi:hypothetical protein
MKKTAEQQAAENAKTFAEIGPRLSYRYGSYVIARDPERGRILIGGLGSMGMGEMWMTESDGDKSRPGYDEAPVRAE